MFAAGSTSMYIMRYPTCTLEILLSQFLPFVNYDLYFFSTQLVQLVQPEPQIQPALVQSWSSQTSYTREEAKAFWSLPTILCRLES